MTNAKHKIMKSSSCLRISQYPTRANISENRIQFIGKCQCHALNEGIHL